MRARSWLAHTPVSVLILKLRSKPHVETYTLTTKQTTWTITVTNGVHVATNPLPGEDGLGPITWTTNPAEFLKVALSEQIRTGELKLEHRENGLVVHVNDLGGSAGYWLSNYENMVVKPHFETMRQLERMRHA